MKIRWMLASAGLLVLPLLLWMLTFGAPWGELAVAPHGLANPGAMEECVAPPPARASSWTRGYLTNSTQQFRRSLKTVRNAIRNVGKE